MPNAASDARRDESSRLIGIVIGLGLLCIAGFVALFSYMLWDAQREIDRQTKDSAHNVLRAVGQDIARTFEFYDLYLQGVVDHLRLPDLAALSPEARKRILFDRATDDPYLETVYVTDAAGRVIEASNSVIDDTSEIADRDFFRAQRGHADAGLSVSQPYLTKDGLGGWVIALSRRINNPDGSFAGVVAGTISLDYFSHVFEQLTLGGGSLVMLHGSGQVLVMRHPYDGNRIGATEPDYDTGDLREGEYRKVSATDGVERIILFQRIGNLPLVASIGLSVSELSRAWQGKAVPLALSMAALTLMPLLLGVLLTRELRRRRQIEATLRFSEERYRLISERSVDAIVLRNRDGVRVFASPAFFKIIGYTAEQFNGMQLADILSDDCRNMPRDDVERLLAGEDAVVQLLHCRHGDGTWIWIETVSTLVHDASGQVTGIVSNLRNVTRRKMAEDRLAETAAQLAVTAMKDALTGLDNRRSFDSHIERAWRRSVRRGTSISLLMIDIDHFKTFNDHFGHVHGDSALRDVAECIAAWMRRDYDLAARYGGEEFAILLPETDESGARHIAENIRATVVRKAVPHPQSPHQRVTLSIGVATLTAKNGRNHEDLVLLADAALYRAKDLGRNRVECAEVSTDFVISDRRSTAGEAA